MFQKFKNIILEADLFYSTEIIKYHGNTQYKTLLGSIISMILIVSLCVGFSSMIGSTFDKTTIQSKFHLEKIINPGQLKLNGQENNFMFGLFIHPMESTKIYDLLNGPQIFDINSFMVELNNGNFTNITSFPLQVCTKQHWKHIPSLDQRFFSMQMDKWICPQKNASIFIQGLSTNQIFKGLYLQVNVCKNSTFNRNKCASQAIIDQTFAKKTNFYFRVTFSNAIINPSEPNPIQYYLYDRSSLLFSTTLGTNMNIKFSDYTIETDESILPYQQIKTLKGYIINENPSSIAFSISNNSNSLAKFLLSKSNDQYKYEREVLKISAVLSYIGGLISALTVALFLVKSYTETSLEINLSIDMFKEEPQDLTEVRSQKMTFNFLDYVKFQFYKILKFFNKADKFKIESQLQKYQDQMEKQLDIRIILQRIIKLQSCMSYLFDSDEIQGIKKVSQITCERAKYLRTLLHETNQTQPLPESALKPDKPYIHKQNQGQSSNQSAHSSIHCAEHMLSRFHPKNHQILIESKKNSLQEENILNSELQSKQKRVSNGQNNLQIIRSKLHQLSTDSLVKQKILQDLRKNKRQSLINAISQISIPDGQFVELKPKP